jgi:hypothetical protein
MGWATAAGRVGARNQPIVTVFIALAQRSVNGRWPRTAETPSAKVGLRVVRRPAGREILVTAVNGLQPLQLNLRCRELNKLCS